MAATLVPDALWSLIRPLLLASTPRPQGGRPCVSDRACLTGILLDQLNELLVLELVYETTNGYRFYFGVYVRSVSRFTPIYMALIDPFRKLVVYPSLLRTILAKWNKTFGAD